jgi:hypothetical protein
MIRQRSLPSQARISWTFFSLLNRNSSQCSVRKLVALALPPFHNRTRLLEGPSLSCRILLDNKLLAWRRSTLAFPCSSSPRGFRCSNNRQGSIPSFNSSSSSNSNSSHSKPRIRSFSPSRQGSSKLSRQAPILSARVCSFHSLQVLAIPLRSRVKDSQLHLSLGVSKLSLRAPLLLLRNHSHSQLPRPAGLGIPSRRRSHYPFLPPRRGLLHSLAPLCWLVLWKVRSRWLHSRQVPVTRLPRRRERSLRPPSRGSQP